MIVLTESETNSEMTKVFNLLLPIIIYYINHLSV